MSGVSLIPEWLHRWLYVLWGRRRPDPREVVVNGAADVRRSDGDHHDQGGDERLDLVDRRVCRRERLEHEDARSDRGEYQQHSEETPRRTHPATIGLGDPRVTTHTCRVLRQATPEAA